MSRSQSFISGSICIKAFHLRYNLKRLTIILAHQLIHANRMLPPRVIPRERTQLVLLEPCGARGSPSLLSAAHRTKRYHRESHGPMPMKGSRTSSTSLIISLFLIIGYTIGLNYRLVRKMFLTRLAAWCVPAEQNLRIFFLRFISFQFITQALKSCWGTAVWASFDLTSRLNSRGTLGSNIGWPRASGSRSKSEEASLIMEQSSLFLLFLFSLSENRTIQSDGGGSGGGDQACLVCFPSRSLTNMYIMAIKSWKWCLIEVEIAPHNKMLPKIWKTLRCGCAHFWKRRVRFTHQHQN